MKHVTFFSCCLVSVAGISVAPAGAGCIDYADYLHWVESLATGTAVDVAVSGSLAFTVTSLLSGVGLQVIDIDPLNPGGPEILASMPLVPGGVANRCIAAAGTHAYVAECDYCQGGAFVVVDAENPHDPAITGQVEIIGDTAEIAVSGTYAYLATKCLFSGLQVIDVSNPFNPRIVGNVQTPGDAVGVAVVGNYAYVSAIDWQYPYAGSLQVIDISHPEDPQIVGSVVMPYYDVGAVAVSGSYAYVRVGGNIQTVDISDPRDPQLLGDIDAGGDGCELAVMATHLLVTGNGLEVIDIEDPLDLRIDGRIDIPNALAVAVGIDQAYVVNGGFHVVSLANTRNPPLVGSVDTPGRAHDVTVAGTIAFVADSYAGLQVIDVSDPTAPVILGSGATSANAECVDIVGTFVYVALRNDGIYGPAGGLSVFDVTNPQDPVPVATVAASHRSRAMAISGAHAYLAGGTDTAGYLSIIDIQEPHDPRIVGTLDCSGYAYGLAVAGNFAYVSVRTVNYPYFYSLRVVDVSNPQVPQIVTSLPVSPSNCIAIAGHYAYLGGVSCQVVDITDPQNPELVASVDSPANAGNFSGVTVSGSYVYAAFRSSYDVIDVTDPEHPRTVGTGPGGEGSVDVDGDYVYSAVGTAGLWIRQAQCDASTGVAEEPVASLQLRVQAFPNPTRGRTVVHFALADAAGVVASIYDVAGRRVRSLYQGVLAPGPHELSWDGRDGEGRSLPAGTYLVRIATANTSRGARILILK